MEIRKSVKRLMTTVLSLLLALVLLLPPAALAAAGEPPEGPYEGQTDGQEPPEDGADGETEDPNGETEDSSGETEDSNGETEDPSGETENSDGETEDSNGETRDEPAEWAQLLEGRREGPFCISQEGVNLIKEFEGFRSRAYLDNGRWYIGYGVLVDANDYPYGIDQYEAEVLMRRALVEKEDAVNLFLAENGLAITQQQYDALVSFTYNMGIGWLKANAGYRLYDYLVDGIEWYEEEEIVDAFGGWCHQGTKTMKSLVNRRLREAYLFLYGAYNNDAPSLYTYIDFDADGGTVQPNRTAFYRIGGTYGQLPVPTRAGYGFLGWYTAGGDLLTEDLTAQSPITVTARWVKIGGTESLDFLHWVNPFTDVAEDQWFFSYVRELNAKKIVSGFPDRTFRPSNGVTAGEALKMLLLAVGNPDPGNAVDGVNWADNYLALALELGCVEPGEIEDLDAPVDRLTIAHITAKAMGLTSGENELPPFADVDDGYVRTLYEEGIFIGEVISGQRYFYPDQSITRAEIAAVICRISGWKPQEETNDPEETGYIEYAGKQIPILPDVPKCAYDPYLFVKSNGRMSYSGPDYTAVVGVDVAVHQGDIDWQAVADSGIKFAMIRLGYRGNSAGTLNLDKKFWKNLEGARAAGLDVGVYFFSQAITPEEAREEARFVLETLDGVELEYPVAYDWENESGQGWRTDKLDKATLTDCVLAFCDEVEQAGYTPMVYYNLYIGLLKMELERQTGYAVWLAELASSPTMYYDFQMWQYSHTGSVPGITGKVDMDVMMIPTVQPPTDSAFEEPAIEDPDIEDPDIEDPDSEDPTIGNPVPEGTAP